MGKTAFSLNLAKKVENYNIPLVISLEMSRQQIIYRFIAYAQKLIID
jgi:replicative DNA helicase